MEHSDEERLTKMEGIVSRIKTDLYNGDDHPDVGLVPEIRAYLVEEKAERARRWRRSDKIAIAAILVVLSAWPANQCWDFVHTLYQITQEWHQIHKSEIPRQSFFNAPQPENATNHQPPQDATLPQTYERK